MAKTFALPALSGPAGPIPGFALGHPQVTPTLPFGATHVGPFGDLENFAERHRPKALADLYGQGAAVEALATFAEAPYPVAFLFEGPTGVGKTSAALALAAELGADEFWGVHRIKSGEQDAAAVELALNSLRFAAMGTGSGWKVVIVDEADYMSPKAAQLWLSALEFLPPKSVVIFTTNHVGKMADRFLDRCERIPFASEGRSLAQDAQALIDSIWTAETGSAIGRPDAAAIPGLVDRDGNLSFRRAVIGLAPALRGRGVARVVKPVASIEPAPPVKAPEKGPPVPVVAPESIATAETPKPAAKANNPAPSFALPDAIPREITKLRAANADLDKRLEKMADRYVAADDKLREALTELKAVNRRLRGVCGARLAR